MQDKVEVLTCFFICIVTAVTELIRFTVSGSPAELSAHMPLVVVLVPQVMALRPRFTATVKVGRPNCQGREDGCLML